MVNDNWLMVSGVMLMVYDKLLKVNDKCSMVSGARLLVRHKWLMVS